MIKENIVKKRMFNDMSETEIDTKVAETVYYYLLSDVIESKDDAEANKDAMKTMYETWDKRDEICNRIRTIVLSNMSVEDTYEDFEDSLFEATEHELY